MKLRTDQMKMLGEVAWAEFERRLMAHWRESAPRRVRELEDEPLRALVRRAIAEAREKGLTSELDIATHADLCLAVGTGFAALPPPRPEAKGR